MTIRRRMTMIPLVILFLIYFLTLTLEASFYEPGSSMTGTVTEVFDGDTIQIVIPEHTKSIVRLYGIDAPEVAIKNHRTGMVIVPGQPFGEEARTYLSSMILGKRVRLFVISMDRSHRLNAIVWSNEKNANLEMIKAGMAETYSEYLKVDPYRSEFIQADIEATIKKIGIWSQRTYERPSAFRKRMKTKGY
jgi:micrococcal nuclease